MSYNFNDMYNRGAINLRRACKMNIFTVNFFGHRQIDKPFAIEVCSVSADKYFKAAHQTRNRSIVDRSDLVIFCVEHSSGMAYQTKKYADKIRIMCIILSEPNE